MSLSSLPSSVVMVVMVGGLTTNIVVSGDGGWGGGTFWMTDGCHRHVLVMVLDMVVKWRGCGSSCFCQHCCLAGCAGGWRQLLSSIVKAPVMIDHKQNERNER